MRKRIVHRKMQSIRDCLSKDLALTQSIWRERNYKWTKSRNKLVRLSINYWKWLSSASRIWSVLTVKYAGFFICKNGTRKRVHRASHTDTTPCNSVELLHTEICAACALNWMTDVLDRARGGPPSPLRSSSSLFLFLSHSITLSPTLLFLSHPSLFSLRIVRTKHAHTSRWNSPPSALHLPDSR